MKTIHKNALCEVLDMQNGTFRLYCADISEQREQDIIKIMKQKLTNPKIVGTLKLGGDLKIDFKEIDYDTVVDYFVFKKLKET